MEHGIPSSAITLSLIPNSSVTSIIMRPTVGCWQPGHPARGGSSADPSAPATLSLLTALPRPSTSIAHRGHIHAHAPQALHCPVLLNSGSTYPRGLILSPFLSRHP